MHSAAHYTVPLDHPAFAGHFPGMPILPGVVLLDIALHTLSAATGLALDSCEIRSLKFLSPARPGDRLEIQHRRASGDTLRFDIMAGTRAIASGSIAAPSADVRR